MRRYQTPKFKIVSGGQTGADQAALDWAIRNEVPHGGWCPKGRRSEVGPIPSCYMLTETPETTYLQRTEWNVRDSDATVIITTSDVLSGGSQKTAEIAARLAKPCLHVTPSTTAEMIAQFLAFHSVITLNVAGSRESKEPGIRSRVLDVLDAVLELP